MRPRALVLWHTSRIQLSLVAAVVAATCALVLRGRIEPIVSALIAAGTFAVYTFDDVLDRPADEREHPRLVPLHRLRSVWFMVALPLSLAAMGFIVARHALHLALPMALAGGVSVAFCIVSMPRLTGAPRSPVRDALFVSAVWSIVLVIVPALASGAGIDIAALLTLSFIWEQTFVIVYLWRACEAGEGTAVEALAPHRRMLPILRAVCLVSFAQILLGVALRLFTPALLAVAVCPLGNLAAVELSHRWRGDSWLMGEVTLALNLACCALVIVSATPGQPMVVL
jgi:hypothetical protein